MATNPLKDGTRVRYTARVHEGTGKIIETYKRKTGVWVIVHDAKRNVAITLRPSQVFSLRSRKAGV